MTATMYHRQTVTILLFSSLACLSWAQQPTVDPPGETTFDVSSIFLTTTEEPSSETTDVSDVSTSPTPSGDLTTIDTTSATEVTTVEGGIHKESVPAVGAETTTERKPVVEPLFIKKYWPLLCFKSKCDRKHVAVIPSVDAGEVRTDLEEPRFFEEHHQTIDDDIVSFGPTTENSSEEETTNNKTEETSEKHDSSEEDDDDD